MNEYVKEEGAYENIYGKKARNLTFPSNKKSKRKREAGSGCSEEATCVCVGGGGIQTAHIL